MNKPKYGLTSNIIYILKNVWRIDKILLFAMIAMVFVNCLLWYYLVNCWTAQEFFRCLLPAKNCLFQKYALRN